MHGGLRMTMPTQAVLRALLGDPRQERYGLELCELADLPSGTLYPILARLERAGWVESRWEDPTAHVAEGRPRRRYYRVTADGAQQAREAIAKAYRARRQRVPGWVAGPVGDSS
ncbi:DNA-binding PadR family transcriptional regulator [Nonomuraea thailandensis]|uniref:DNA-binding PadR family transcriptional regulator n=1 Tax=Nonomuraea thailandensis TaxID=1188745 RepID=A0A9X2GGW3_9ACTN|nr:PadR family transcriptional regulator [Nonomuraea thailandensis]MCP2354438.1 DNA-binding PadR family transcriptional regulator [Nonomuraea thailandensis]